MNRNNPITCAWCLDHIEPYLDDELMAVEADSLNSHVITCSSCAKELALAVRIRTSLQDMLLPDVPKTVTEGVYEQISIEQRSQHRFWQSTGRRAIWRGLALAAAVILAVLIGSRYKPTPEPPMAISAEELASAETQAKWAIAYISDVGRRTGLTVRDEVIAERVANTLQKGVKTIDRQTE